MKLFYGSNTENMPEGATFRNAGFFEGVMPDVTLVYLDGDYPRIEEAYRAEGIDVQRVDNVAPVYAPAPDSLEAAAVAEGAGAVAIPADWRNLPWTQPDERGVTLKGLASAVSDSTIRSKDDAVSAIEAYLAGDLDKPLPEAGGLTRRQLNADLEVLGLEIEPDEAPADTATRIAEKRESEAENAPE